MYKLSTKTWQLGWDAQVKLTLMKKSSSFVEWQFKLPVQKQEGERFTVCFSFLKHKLWIFSRVKPGVRKTSEKICKSLSQYFRIEHFFCTNLIENKGFCLCRLSTSCRKIKIEFFLVQFVYFGFGFFLILL